MGMVHPFSRTQTLQNRTFLRILARTGNARLAAREVGVSHNGMHHRRRSHPGFAQRWDSAVAAAQTRLWQSGGKGRGLESAAAAALRQAQGERGTEGRRTAVRQAHGKRGKCSDPLRTAGGEPVVVRTRDGRLQVRPAHSGKLTKAAEQAFLAALSETANIRFAAEAAGASEAAFHRRKRQCPAFAAKVAEAKRLAHPRVERAAAEACARAAEEALRKLEEEEHVWPKGLSVTAALHQLKMPPMMLPGMQFRWVR
jgi:hypothetical protein